MKVLAGGAAVMDPEQYTSIEGTRRFRVPISASMGSRDISQSISGYCFGAAPARRNPASEEVLYVVRGEGVCHLAGHRYPLEPGTAVYIPPGEVYQVDNSGGALDGEDLLVVSVCCPEDAAAEVGVEPVYAFRRQTTPFRSVREHERESIQAGDRTFKLLVNRETGCRNVTQFIGVIPPGRAPLHHHTYEEAIYIIDGGGIVWTEEGSAAYSPGSSIYLPRGVRHSLENTGSESVRLLGVFHPSGSPASSYEDESA